MPFIVAANARELSQTVNRVYGDGFDGSGYVERFFDIWLPLPVGDRENFRETLLGGSEFQASRGQGRAVQRWVVGKSGPEFVFDEGPCGAIPVVDRQVRATIFMCQFSSDVPGFEFETCFTQYPEE